MTVIMDEAAWQRAVAHLSVVEPVLVPLIRAFPDERIRSSGDAFQVLANSIVGQQISVKAAAAIFGRLTASLGGEWRPERVVSLSNEVLRADGLSTRKLEYLRELSEAFMDGRVHPELWNTASDDEVLKELVSLRGIGRWTAEMFLIFHLQRPDILPLDDIGLLRSAAQIFHWDYPFAPETLELRAETWRPWRTVAVWYLWRNLDPHPVIY